MVAGIKDVAGVVQHNSTIDPQAKGIGIGCAATIVVDNGLDHRQSRRKVIIGQGADGRISKRQGDGIRIVLYTPHADPGAGAVANRAAAF